MSAIGIPSLLTATENNRPDNNPVITPCHAENTKHGINRDNLDPTANLKDDFYQYACGGWMKNHPMTDEYARYGMFDLLRENAKTQLNELIVNLKNNPESKIKGTNAQKVSDIYELGMDSIRLNKEGAAPVMPFVEKALTATHDNLASILAWQHNGIGASFFSTGVGADVNDADTNIMHIGETGLGLGDRDYYLISSEENSRIVEAYMNYIRTICKLCGFTEPEADRIADNVLDLEKKIAEHKMTREMRRNPKLRNNVMTFGELTDRFPNIDWTTYFTALEIPVPEKVNIGSLGYMEFLNQILPELTEQQIRDYLVYEVIAESSQLLSDDFVDADFEMFSKTLSGKKEQEPRWKRAMAIPNSMFGEAIGQLYVEKYFPEENKKAMKRLVNNLQVALGQHIDSLQWMSDETKKKAREKLSKFRVKIGYPDKWKDYSGITIDPTKSYMENCYEASKWYKHDNYVKVGKPVDREEWLMTPQTVNAYYMPTTNEICFPAAILQAPYFDVTADDAMNYGAIGVVIGHEMTHGFDDSGRQYNKDGNLEDWWTPEDAEKFTALADKLVDQFNQVEVLPDLYANGKFTLGENIADQGGLRVALTAYQNSLENKEGEIIDGMTPLQRFYLAYANLWASNIRDEEAARLTKMDSHSLGRNRVNVTLRNISPFFEAFDITEKDKMYRPEEERVIIW
ncbi:MAG: M13 family metallopeptidase [Muribaculaceae bacterium]|nr:M13 family metallopeptidase [Muribaculaceae bacterium]